MQALIWINGSAVGRIDGERCRRRNCCSPAKQVFAARAGLALRLASSTMAAAGRVLTSIGCRVLGQLRTHHRPFVCPSNRCQMHCRCCGHASLLATVDSLRSPLVRIKPCKWNWRRDHPCRSSWYERIRHAVCPRARRCARRSNRVGPGAGSRAGVRCGGHRRTPTPC